MSEELLPIGQFAQLGRLSIKQLRRYDELGLLRPAHVDAATGYRFYTPAQARDALAIGLLRSLDVPLADIAAVLAGQPGVLTDVRDCLEAELARRRRTLTSLERILADGLPETEVRLLHQPAQHVALVTETIADPAEIGRATSAAIARLLAATGGRPGPLTGLFPLDLTGPIQIRVAMTLTVRPAPGTRGSGDDQTARGSGTHDPTDDDGWPVVELQAWRRTGARLAGAREEVLPGGRFAAATHVGPYDQIGLTAHALLSWCAGRHPVTGPLREVYVSDPATTPPSRLITHLLIPLDPADAQEDTL